MTPSTRPVLSGLIAAGEVTPIKKFVKQHPKIPLSAVKEANIAVNYGVMDRESSPQIKKREEIEKILEKTQPLATQLRLKFGFGGKRTHTHKRKAKTLKIPPVVAEEGIEILAEIAVGGKRRKTRKNK